MSQNADSNKTAEPDQGELFNAVDAELQAIALSEIEDVTVSNSALAESIAVLGNVSVPILQEQQAGLPYRVVDGRRRIAALRAQSDEDEEVKIDAFVIGPGVEAEADALTAAMNIQREPNPIEEAKAISRLINQGYTPESLSRILSIPRPTIEKRLRLSNAPAEIRNAVEEGNVAEGAAERVANLSASLQQECVQHLSDEGELRHKDIDAVRQADVEERVEQVDQTAFETPDVGRKAPDTTPGGDGSPGAPEGDSGDESGVTADVDLPTDADCFQDYIMIAGAVREYVVGDEYDTAKEAVQGAIAAGTKRGLTPEEVLTLLRTGPAHFLDGSVASVADDLHG